MHHFEQAMKVLLEIHYPTVEDQVKTGWVGLFGQSIRADFLCASKNGTQVVYEVKFQEVTGSADQKLVFAVEQIKQCHKIPTYLVLAGCGWSKGALKWGKSQSSTEMFLGVVGMDEFLQGLKNV